MCFGAPFYKERGQQVGLHPSKLCWEADLAAYSGVFLHYPAANVDSAFEKPRAQ
jgi:hypothetical protein